MTKRRTDRQLADDIVVKLNSEEDKAAYPAMEITSLLQRARDAGGGALRMQYLETAQREIAKLDPSRHGKLINQLQGEVLALQGRRGDTRVAHVTPGEVVIPARLQTPELLAALRAAAREAGIDPARLQVGSSRNSINPRTGQAEFNDSLADTPTYESLGFDPNGPGMWRTALGDPLGAISAFNNSDTAKTATRMKYGNVIPHNNEADAYRHAAWSNLLTRSIGADRAKAFTDAYDGSNPNPDSEHLMDLYNNQVGRNLPTTTPGPIGVRDSLHDAINKKSLRIEPFIK